MNVSLIARRVSFAFVFALALPAWAEVHGSFRVVKGDVQIKSAQTGQTTKARIGQEVYPKDTIVTGKDARAKIVMIDNNEINVSPDSNVEIQNYEFNPAENKKDVLLNVLYGKVRSKVEQKYDGKTSKFQVKTPSAVAGVRGTDFITSYSREDHSSQVVTFRGAVEFGTPGPNGSIQNSVSVTPGKTASSNNGAPPGAPTNVPKGQLAQMDKDSQGEGPGEKDGRVPADDKHGKKGEKGNDNNSNSSGNGSSGGSNSAANGASNGGNSTGSSTSNSASNSGNGAAGGSGMGDSGGRAPASTPAGSMIIVGSDTISNTPSNNAPVASQQFAAPPPPPPPPPLPPPPPPPPPQPPNLAVQGNIQSGNTKAPLTINVKP